MSGQTEKLTKESLLTEMSLILKGEVLVGSSIYDRLMRIQKTINLMIMTNQNSITNIKLSTIDKGDI